MQILNNIVSKKSVREVKYFHPTGQTLPNGSHIQRGGFLHECQQNKNAYTLDQTVHGQSCASAQRRGGIIIFPAGVDTDPMSSNTFVDSIKHAIETFQQPSGKEKPIRRALSLFAPNSKDSIVAYSVGHSFRGTYVVPKGETYNQTSLSLEVNGLSTPSLLRLAQHLAVALPETLAQTQSAPHHQSPLLLKDLNTDKILLLSAPSPR